MVTHTPACNSWRLPLLPIPTNSQNKCTSPSRSPNSNQPSSTSHRHRPTPPPRCLLRHGVPLLRSPRHRLPPLDALPARLDHPASPPREPYPQRPRLQMAPRQISSRTPLRPPPSQLPNPPLAVSDYAPSTDGTIPISSSFSTVWYNSSGRSRCRPTLYNPAPSLLRPLRLSQRSLRRPGILFPLLRFLPRTTQQTCCPPTPGVMGPLPPQVPRRSHPSPLRLARAWISPAAAIARETVHLLADFDPTSLLHAPRHLAPLADGATRHWSTLRPHARTWTCPDGARPLGPAPRVVVGVAPTPPAPLTPGMIAGALPPRTTWVIVRRRTEPRTTDPPHHPDMARPRLLFRRWTARSQGRSSSPAPRCWTHGRPPLPSQATAPRHSRTMLRHQLPTSTLHHASAMTRLSNK